MKYQILKALKKGQRTISSKVAKSFNISRRKALEHLSILEEEGLLSSEMDICRFPSGSRSKARVFKKI